nr:hypothetical protein [Pandoravirus aubagnensis]
MGHTDNVKRVAHTSVFSLSLCIAVAGKNLDACRMCALLVKGCGFFFFFTGLLFSFISHCGSRVWREVGSLVPCGHTRKGKPHFFHTVADLWADEGKKKQRDHFAVLPAYLL